MMGLYLPSSSLAQTPAAERRSCSALTQDPSPYVSALPAPVEAVPNRLFEVIARYPHDRNAFTEGLAFYQGELYESTGIRGQSSVRKLDLKSGRALKTRPLNQELFGEGLTVVGQQLVQLTWESGSAFVYAPDDLRQTGSFNFSGEGWGITSMDARLVISDGSSWLRLFNAGDYQQIASLQVTDGGRPLEGLNELETVDGLIYANVYPSDCIAQIDPQSGRVVAWIDLNGLMPLSERPHHSAVANGIAYNPETGELFVTGKLWPYIYQLKLLKTDALPDKRAAAPGITDWRPQR
jgi:glutamine cyclotransferase